MGRLLANLLFLLIWYGILLTLLWITVGSIRNGDAGASGVPLLRTESPVWFWARIVWRLIWFAVFAALPLYIYMKTGTIIQ
jgi:hypothetical protein